LKVKRCLFCKPLVIGFPGSILLQLRTGLPVILKEIANSDSSERPLRYFYLPGQLIEC
jgi:hypothetical protein